LLCWVVREEYEGLESSIWVLLLVDTPQDMAEERLEVDRDSALGTFLMARELAAIASGPVWRL
jgi:hypothetical protein